MFGANNLTLKEMYVKIERKKKHNSKLSIRIFRIRRKIGVGKCRIKRDVNHTSMSPVSNGQANIMLHSLRSKTIITLKNCIYIYNCNTFKNENCYILRGYYETKVSTHS